MDKETESSKSPEEIELFLKDKPTAAVRKTETCEANAAKVTFELEEDAANSHLDEDRIICIKLWKNCTLSISKTLIPLRLATLLWFGAGRLIIVYFGVFLRERGLTLTEISTAFSLIFISHFFGASISGVIADKIGNAKPVLIFYMCATLATIICLLFMPNVGVESCPRQNTTILELSGFESETDFEYCNRTCLGSPRGNSQTLLADDYVKSNSTISEEFITFLGNSTYAFNTSASAIVDNYPDNKSCTTLCDSPSPSGCSSTHRRLFTILYSALILTFFAFWSTTYRFLDYSGLCLVDRTTSHFGKERFFGSVGELIISAAAAFVLIAGTSAVKKYESMFWVSAALVLLSVLSACKVHAVILPPGRKLTRKALKLIKNSEVIAFIAVVYVAGNGYCFNAVFNFWFLDNINAPKLVIGLHPVFSSLYAFPVQLLSRLLIKHFGTNKLIILGILSYAINQLSFSFLRNPWLSLMIEVTVAFHFHLLWIAVVINSRRLAPEGLKATLNALAGSVHFGIGRSSGVAVGALLVNYFGIRTAYRLMSGLCLSTAILYSLFLSRKYLTRKNSDFNEKEHDFEKTEDTESEPIKDINRSTNSDV